MVDIVNIRAHAKDLLEKGTVKMVLGYQRGTAGVLAEPAFITDAGQADHLVWDPTCVQNLALYLVNEKKAQSHQRDPDTRPIAIIAKGCDSRAVAVLLQERHFERKDVHVIGVSCGTLGVVDKNKLSKALNGRVATKVEPHGTDSFKVTTAEGFVDVAAADVLADRCLECACAYPAMHDVVFGEKHEDRGYPARFTALGQLEAKSEDERWAYWEGHFNRCLRCYACRSVCPMCYCPECVVDSIELMVDPTTSADEKANRIKWIERSAVASENSMYHLVRAIHLAGRCIDCAECERVCPVDIPIRMLNNKLEKEAKDMFGYEPGLDPELPSLVASFRDDDPNSFIR